MLAAVEPGPPLMLGPDWTAIVDARPAAWRGPDGCRLDWAPVDSLRFRVMAQRAIRAPNISELFQQPRESVFELFAADPCSASADPVGSGVADLCVAQGVPADQLGIYEAQPGFPTGTSI